MPAIPLAGPTAVTRYVMGTGQTQSYTVDTSGTIQSLSVSESDLGGRTVAQRDYYKLGEPDRISADWRQPAVDRL